ATSMLVYNTATAGVSPNNVIPGYYYNAGTPAAPNWLRVYAGTAAGTEWKLLGNVGTAPATNFIGTTDAVDLVFRTNNTEKVRIMSGGNVGIGTASPAYRLDLANGTFGFGSSNVRTETRDNAGLQGNAGAQSGFFETAGPTNYPAGASSWWHLIDVRHSNNSNNYALQIAGSFFDQNLYFRKTNNSATTAWSQLITTNSNLAWLTTGNAGTVASSNFIGTTDAIDFVVRTNNVERMRVLSGGNVGINTNTPSVPLAVNGSGVNVYATDAWIENNMHVQGNETLTQGGRGRMRVGTAWNYMGLYTDASSTGAASDLVLGASSGLVRIGCNGCGQNFKVSGLEGTTTQPVYATSNGVLTRTPPAGQVLNVVMVNGGNMGTNVTVNSTTFTTVITTTYTPVSNNSFLIVECSIDYQIGGTNTDSWVSRITVDGTQAGMCYQYWNNGSGGGTRGGVLFPLMGRYENSSTTTKTINAQAARSSSDDNGTFYRYSASTWIKITEVQK
ncbi:MAG: hypothetical protein EBU01_06010, partial [Crocinitomicaceae bacterium]|nr:hypothetical protein [Crocinitomicaceae bacterium]